MISVEKFKKSIEFMSSSRNLVRSINSLLVKNFRIMGDTQLDNNQSENIIIDLLNDSMGLKDTWRCETDLEYWCLEKDFGSDFKVGDIINNWLPKDHKYYKPELDTVEKLYDYLVFLSGEYNHE